jgi:hypothetical protein
VKKQYLIYTNWCIFNMRPPQVLVLWHDTWIFLFVFICCHFENNLSLIIKLCPTNPMPFCFLSHASQFTPLIGVNPILVIISLIWFDFNSIIYNFIIVLYAHILIWVRIKWHQNIKLSNMTHSTILNRIIVLQNPSLDSKLLSYRSCL